MNTEQRGGRVERFYLFLPLMLNISSQKSQYFMFFCGYILNGFFSFHPFFSTGIVSYDIAALLTFKGAATEIVFINRSEESLF